MRLRRQRADSSIPTSSTADIAFLLIIFFMVTSVFSATKGLEMDLPPEQPESQPKSSEEAVWIHIQADRLVVDCREMGLGEILPYLAPRLRANPGKPVILYTDGEAEYRKMVQVYDLLAGAGVREIAVPTQADIDAYTGWFGVNPFEAACS